MILLKIKGGLGNQLFEYAFARWLQEKTGEPIEADTSLLHSERQAHEVYILDKFNAGDHVKIHSKGDIKGFKYLLQIMMFQVARYSFAGIGRAFGKKCQYRVESFLQPLINRLGIHLCADGHIPQRAFGHAERISEGYWQSAKYFKGIEDVIRCDCLVKTVPTAKNARLIENMKQSQSVCVHVRRGDYVTNPEHLVCTPSYYIKAMSEIATRVVNPEFYIFSDDIAWVKENLPFEYSVNYIEPGNANYEELRLMYSCRHFVISNSSFSWWAQYLCDNSEKVVVAPNRWYADERKADLFMDDWLRIET